MTEIGKGSDRDRLNVEVGIEMTVIQEGEITVGTMIGINIETTQETDIMIDTNLQRETVGLHLGIKTNGGDFTHLLGQGQDQEAQMVLPKMVSKKTYQS